MNDLEVPIDDEPQSAETEQSKSFIDFLQDMEQYDIADANETDLKRYIRTPLISHNNREGKFKVVAYWGTHGDEFPSLKRAAKDYLATPATTSSVERMFNSGRDQIGIRRYRLSAECLRELMVMQESAK